MVPPGDTLRPPRDRTVRGPLGLSGFQSADKWHETPAQSEAPQKPPGAKRVGRVVLPYSARPGQLELASKAFDALASSSHAILEAGTGTGKTVAVLAAALAASRDDGRKVVWLTRTNQQARQVLVELKAIRQDPQSREAAGEDLLAVFMQGRHHQCPKLRDDARYAGADAEEYARLCASLKRSTPKDRAHAGWNSDGLDSQQADGLEGSPAHGDLPVVSGKGCSYYEGLLHTDPQGLVSRLADAPMDAQELGPLLESEGLCPYEAAKGLLAEARLVVAPYIYLANPALAKAMEQWMGGPLSDCVLVVDEAHNLPDHLREVHSAQLGLESLDRALSEARKSGDVELGGGVTASRFVRTVKRAVEQLAHERLPAGEEDARVRSEDLLVPLLAGLRVASPALLSMVAALATEGERIRAEALRRGRLPRSYLGTVARFLAAWVHASPTEHVPLVEAGPPPRLVMYCMDPSLGSGFLGEVQGSVHISGTLRPLAAHRDLLGLPGDSTCAVFLSPFPRENLRLVLVDDVTTRYEERNRDGAMMDRLAGHVEGFATTGGVNAMLLFPSHAMLAETKSLVLDGVARRLFVETPGGSQRQLRADLDAFRAHSRSLVVDDRRTGRTKEDGDGKQGGDAKQDGEGGALWVGVMGGRISEGMDFPGATLEALCLVGVPYPRPTARHEALLEFNEVRFGRGWEYTVEAPALRRVQQAVGRVIRDASDTGIVFLLDSRYRKWADEFGRLERLGDEERIAEVLAQWVEADRRRPDRSKKSAFVPDADTGQDSRG